MDIRAHFNIDTNFKMSLKEKGIKSDPALGDAWAHWVPREEFYEYLRNHGGTVEVCDLRNTIYKSIS